MSKRRLAQVNPQESDHSDNHDDHFDENGKLKKVKWEHLTSIGKVKRVFENVEHCMFVFTKYFCGFWRYAFTQRLFPLSSISSPFHFSSIARIFPLTSKD